MHLYAAVFGSVTPFCNHTTSYLMAKVPHSKCLETENYIRCCNKLTWEREEEGLQDQQVKPVENLDVM